MCSRNGPWFGYGSKPSGISRSAMGSGATRGGRRRTCGRSLRLACLGMPVVEGLSFSYRLYELPPGRLPFRRWRWELWHGSRLEAAGWRISRGDAERALRVHAARVGHAMFGLPAPSPEAATSGGALRPGAAVRVSAGAVAFSLVPRHLERPAGLAPATP